MSRNRVIRRVAFSSAFSVLALLCVLTQVDTAFMRSGLAASPLASFTNSSAIAIPTSGAAALYPSTINVSGQTGVVTAVTVRLNGFSHTSPGDVDVLLVSPDGRKFKVVSDAGSTTGAPTGQATVNVTVTFTDAAAAVLPTGDTKWGLDNSTFTARPTDYGGTTDTMPGGAPAPPYGTPAPTGTDTLNGFFNGATPNGNWNLYVADDTTDDSGNISGGWTLDITTAAGSAATTTTVASSANPSTAGNSVTFTATITSSSTVNNGTVTFADGVSNLTCTEGAQPRPVNGSGQAACTSTGLAGGNRTINANYTPGSGFLASAGSMLQQVTTVSGSTFSNVGNITVENVGQPFPQQSIPYPGLIQVSGLSGTIATVTLGLNGLTHGDVRDLDVLLVSPAGTPYIPMSDVGTTGAVSNLNLVLADSAASQMPLGATLTSGTFRPTNSGSGDAIPNTTLGTVTASGANTAAPAGSGTLTSAFGGASPNGNWSLYIYDDASGDVGNLAGGWNLTFTTAGGALTTTSVTSSNNPSFTTAPDNQTTLTATVTSSGNPVTTGNVNFKEAGVDLVCTEGAQPRALNGSGQAVCTTSFATEGTHVVTALYNGSASFAISNGSVTQTVNNHTTGTPPQFCNAGPLTIPSTGAATPYPSQIFVSGLTGQATKVTAQLVNVTHTDISDIDVLLVGPGGQKIVLMSDAGGGGQPGTNLNLTFDDAAANSLPTTGAVTSGTYKPTDNPPADSWPAPAPAPPYGTTLAAFLAASPNGTWSVYVVDDTAGDSGAFNGGVCLNFTMGTASTTTSVTSSPNPSNLNQAVTFTATVSVTAPGAGPATGSVQFKDGAANLGSPVGLDGSGQAQLMTSALLPGPHTVTAVYTPTGNFTGSTSPPYMHTVTPPTASNVEVSGRVLTSDGRGVGRATVTLTDSEGRVMTTQTVGRSGMYRFTEVPAGGSYVLAVTSGRFSFAPRVVQIDDNVANLDIVADPLE